MLYVLAIYFLFLVRCAAAVLHAHPYLVAGTRSELGKEGFTHPLHPWALADHADRVFLPQEDQKEGNELWASSVVN